jgi:hypothetical protein
MRMRECFVLSNRTEDSVMSPMQEEIVDPLCLITPPRIRFDTTSPRGYIEGNPANSRESDFKRILTGL